MSWDDIFTLNENCNYVFRCIEDNPRRFSNNSGEDFITVEYTGEFRGMVGDGFNLFFWIEGENYAREFHYEDIVKISMKIGKEI